MNSNGLYGVHVVNNVEMEHKLWKLLLRLQLLMVVQIVLVKEPELKPVSLKNVQSTVNSLGEAMVIVIVTLES